MTIHTKSKNVFLKGFVIATANIAILSSVFADSSREMEPILTINANSAAMLLADEPLSEEVMFVSHEVAATLLGDEMVETTFIDQINSLPVTAAGSDDVIYIDATAAEALLGDVH
ncbi:MAG: hypothetical protein ACI9CE_000157 [Flavobacterium sp.]|jgi:hypothetical protein